MLHGLHSRSAHTVPLDVCEVPLGAMGGPSIGIDTVGLSSTGVFVCRGTSKVQTGDQILEMNGRIGECRI